MSTSTLSKFLRRTHLYVALFLTPWVLLYALSTIVMNHKERPGKPIEWQTVSEKEYDGIFPDGATPQVMGRQLLESLNMHGAHRVNRGKDGSIVVLRLAAMEPMRITYRPENRQMKVERQVVTSETYLEAMHRRRGFQQPYLTDTLWGLTVDLFIVGVLFWVLSGFWMWWELRVTRAWGAVALLIGVALFSLFLVVL